MWRLYSGTLVRFTFSVGQYFDLERTPKCVGDRLEILFGDDQEKWGSYCGSIPPGEAFASLPGVQTVWLRFITDEQVEHDGFDITFRVLPTSSDGPPGLPQEPQK